MFLLADGYIYIVNSLSQEKLHCIRFYVGGKRIQKVLENDSVPELEEINIFFLYEQWVQMDRLADLKILLACWIVMLLIPNNSMEMEHWESVNPAFSLSKKYSNGTMNPHWIWNKINNIRVWYTLHIFLTFWKRTPSN